MKNFLLLSLIILSSCAIGRKIRLDNFSYDMGKTAKVSVDYIKRTEDKFEIKLLGISLDEFPVMIRTDEIECGAGGKNFDKVKVDSLTDGYIIFPKTTYQEFTVYCLKESDMERGATPFLLFKKVYQQQADLTAGKVISTDVSIKFE